MFHSAAFLLAAIAALAQQPQAVQANGAPSTPELQPPPNPAGYTVTGLLAAKDWELNADPDSPEWTGVSGVVASRDTFGEPVKLGQTEVRARWTKKNLYFLFICPYDALNLKPEPNTAKETDKLWSWDVTEVFIGSDYLKPAKYKEFQMSPQGEFVDLDVDREFPEKQKGIEWDSGMTVRARIDQAKKVWYGEMRIPFAAFEKHPKSGDEFRIGIFRVTGAEPKRVQISWRVTGSSSFHMPESFGSLVLASEPEKN